MYGICVATILVGVLAAGTARAQAPAPEAQPSAPQATAQQADAPVRATLEDRPVFNPVVLKKRGFEIVSHTDIQGVGTGLVAVLAHQVLPEAEGTGSGLERISRLFVLAGDRIVFDSFAWDDVGEFVEPSINSRTFFQLSWSVVKGPKTRPFLVLRGITPLQATGEPIRTGQRVLVLSYEAPATFDALVDAVGDAEPVITPTEVRFPLK